ncbi:hypothetical protein [Flagellimonas pacifica]|uniref:DUF7868 domain-containing protein n=1 Tax=Flagellimonas pacifica TaxID=1247520 RepID=A0A285MWV7_9FLAO|nr:hypothetical protein [Allomuricauda parva]SNZ01672.1 hypothetical protein SAMN06265377_3514 [Allomuricauda parva]
MAEQEEHMNSDAIVDKIGNSEGGYSMETFGLKVHIPIKSGEIKAAIKNLDPIPNTGLNDQVLLVIENVRGNEDALMLKVSVDQKNAGNFSLYGIGNASGPAGEGLSFTLDITDIILDIDSEETKDWGTLDVDISPHRNPKGIKDITIGNISVYLVRQQR